MRFKTNTELWFADLKEMVFSLTSTRGGDLFRVKGCISVFSTTYRIYKLT
jgi:hypothetical protein